MSWLDHGFITGVSWALTSTDIVAPGPPCLSLVLHPRLHLTHLLPFSQGRAPPPKLTFKGTGYISKVQEKLI